MVSSRAPSRRDPPVEVNPDQRSSCHRSPSFVRSLTPARPLKPGRSTPVADGTSRTLEGESQGKARSALITEHRYLTPAGTPHNDRVMVRVWEYEVPEMSRAEFERTYGAAGDWAQLFSSSDGFRGTELFASLSDPGRYLTIDRFTDVGAWRALLTEHRDAYASLDAATKGLTTDECELAGGEVS